MNASEDVAMAIALKYLLPLLWGQSTNVCCATCSVWQWEEWSSLRGVISTLLSRVLREGDREWWPVPPALNTRPISLPLLFVDSLPLSLPPSSILTSKSLSNSSHISSVCPSALIPCLLAVVASNKRRKDTTTRSLAHLEDKDAMMR